MFAFYNELRVFVCNFFVHRPKLASKPRLRLAPRTAERRPNPNPNLGVNPHRTLETLADKMLAGWHTNVRRKGI